MKEAAGIGEANNATVDLTGTAVEPDPKAEAARIVAACKLSVEKQKAHLARAEQALADALAYQKGL